jgi:hypothetical protein
LAGVLGVTLGVKTGQLSALAGGSGEQHSDQKIRGKRTKNTREKKKWKMQRKKLSLIK